MMCSVQVHMCIVRMAVKRQPCKVGLSIHLYVVSGDPAQCDKTPPTFIAQTPHTEYSAHKDPGLSRKANNNKILCASC